jgi:transposase
MGRGLALLHGYRLLGPWWRPRQWEKWQTQLPAWMVEHLDRFRPTMNEAEKALLALQVAIRQAGPQELPYGFGAITLEGIEREVLDWSRFKNRKQPGSYVGLCGGVADSGQQRADLPITKHGNRRLRAMLIELAWRVVWYQPDCHAVGPWKAIFQNPRSHARRRKQAIVAVARRLMVDLWRWKTGRATAQDLGWVMKSLPVSKTPRAKSKKTK